MEHPPGGRVFANPRLDALPEDILRDVGRETAYDGLETLDGDGGCGFVGIGCCALLLEFLVAVFLGLCGRGFGRGSGLHIGWTSHPNSGPRRDLSTLSATRAEFRFSVL